jgi:hypothetical protein
LRRSRMVIGFSWARSTHVFPLVYEQELGLE